MKAIVYTEYGSTEVLQFKDVEKPLPKNDEIRVKVKAVEATKADCELRSFRWPVKWFWLPMRFVLGLRKPKRQILGGYFAGEVESVGKEVEKFKKGTRVFGSAALRMGAYAEYMCLPASYTIAAMPSNMSFEEAAAVPLGGLNAIHFMRKARIQKREKVLINGAGGSIGSFALQIAKTMGAEVTAIDSVIKKQMLLDAGADHFIDYTKEDFTKSAQSYDVIFDMVAKSSYSTSLKILNPGGRYLMGNPRMSKMLRSVLTNMFTNKKAVFAFAGETVQELVDLKEMIEQGKIKSIIDKIYPLEQAAQAHRRVETEQRVGIVVLSLGDSAI